MPRKWNTKGETMTERPHKDLIIRFANEPDSEVWCGFGRGEWSCIRTPGWYSEYEYKVIPPQHKEVFLAWTEGKQVQCLSKGYTYGWVDCDDPDFRQSDQYRIKPEKIVEYQNKYPSIGYSKYASREIADQHASDRRIACVRVEWEPGQFDE